MRFVRIPLVLLSSVGVCFLLVTFTPLLFWWARAMAGEWRNDHGGVLLVLAGGQINDETLDVGSYWRTVYAAMAWREGFDAIVVCGGPPDKPIAAVMKRSMETQGVPGERIVLEPDSTSTRENAMFAVPVLAGLGAGRPVLLTSDYHMFRAKACFRRLGVSVSPRPVPDALKRYQRWQERPGIFADLLIECGRIVAYQLEGYI